MTENQKRFADEYLIDLNATRAYKAAYKNVKNDKVAAVNGSKLLRNTKVRKYIDERLEIIRSEKTADAAEVMEYLTAVMRREMQESVVVTSMEEKSEYKPDEKGIVRRFIEKKEVPIIVEIPAKLSDANKAAELLGKRFGLFTDKVEVDGVARVVFEENLSE